MQHSGIKVGPVGPNERVDFRVDSRSVEQLKVAERRVQFARQSVSEIDGLHGAVVEANPQRVRRYDLEINNAIYGMAHKFILAAQSGAGFFLAPAFPNQPSNHSGAIRPTLQPGVAAALVSYRQ